MLVEPGNFWGSRRNVFENSAGQNPQPENYCIGSFRNLFKVFFGFEKQFSEKAKLSVLYNPFIKEFTYAKVITQSQGYYEEWSGSVDVQHLFSVEFVYNFSYGGKVNKINREVEYEKGGGGGTF